MKLFYEPLGIDLDFKNGLSYGLVIESPKQMEYFLNNIWQQSSGNDGEVYLTNLDKEIKFGRGAELIFNPFSLNVNDKKILTKVLGEMNEICDNDFLTEKTALNASIISLVDSICEKMPYAFRFNLNLDFIQILKMYDCSLDYESVCLIERIINYIKLAHQVVGTELFIFVNLQSYISQEDFIHLIECCQYEHVICLCLESHYFKMNNDNILWWIIDKDNCIIEIK